MIIKVAFWYCDKQVETQQRYFFLLRLLHESLALSSGHFSERQCKNLSYNMAGVCGKSLQTNLLVPSGTTSKNQRPCHHFHKKCMPCTHEEQLLYGSSCTDQTPCSDVTMSDRTTNVQKYEIYIRGAPP